MDRQGYIFYLYNIKDRNPKIKEATKEYLGRFALSTNTSAYQIYKYMNSTGRKISYKNVYKNVIRFYELELIKKIERGKTKHNAIYYKLSPLGIFYLFKEGFQQVLWAGHILTNYKNDSLFTLFLYPYISKNAIRNISKSYYIIREISKYLSKCCSSLDTLCSHQKNAECKGRKSYFFRTWNEILAFTSPIQKDDVLASQEKWKEYATMPWMREEFLKSIMRLAPGLEWINVKTPITKINEDVVRIGRGTRSLDFKLDRKRNKVAILQKRKAIYDFDVEIYQELGLMSLVRSEGFTADKQDHEMLWSPIDISKTTSPLDELCLDLVNAFNHLAIRSTEIYSAKQLNEIMQEFKTLSEDAAFIEVFRESKKHILRLMDEFEFLFVNEFQHLTS